MIRLHLTTCPDPALRSAWRAARRRVRERLMPDAAAVARGLGVAVGCLARAIGSLGEQGVLDAVRSHVGAFGRAPFSALAPAGVVSFPRPHGASAGPSPGGVASCTTGAKGAPDG